MRSRRIRTALILLLAGFILWIITGYLVAWQLTRPAPSDYKAISSIGRFTTQQLTLTSPDGTTINAWLAGDNKKSAVILLAGIHSNSSSMVARAQLYLQEGFSVLLPDLRATGKSGGDIITFGWQEKYDLVTCTRWLRANGFSFVAAHGCSLGAATIAYSFDTIRDYGFVVMESCYDNIDHALAHRTFDSGFNRLLFGSVYFFTEMRFGATADQLAPEKLVSRYSGPLLYFAGDHEEQIPLAETQKIFAGFSSPFKTLHVVTGATHRDLYDFAPADYTAALSKFLHSIPPP
jgi:uncharacterized protein